MSLLVPTRPATQLGKRPRRVSAADRATPAAPAAEDSAIAASRLQRHIAKESRCKHGDILYRRLALLSAPRVRPSPLSPPRVPVSPFSGGHPASTVSIVSPSQSLLPEPQPFGEVNHGAPKQPRRRRFSSVTEWSPPLAVTDDLAPFADTSVPHTTGYPRKKRRRPPPIDISSPATKLTMCVEAQKRRRQSEAPPQQAHRLTKMLGWRLADMTADGRVSESQQAHSPQAPSSAASPLRMLPGLFSSSEMLATGAGDPGDDVSGFEQLDQALSRMTRRLVKEEGDEVAEAFARLAAHVDAFRIDSESKRLAELHTRLLRQIDSRTQTREQTALAFFFLDHAFCLHNSVRPELKRVLRKCRDALATAVYCLSDNLLPSTVFEFKDRVAEQLSQAVYRGPPRPPTRSVSETLLSESDEDALGTCNACISAYATSRMNYEDNSLLQEELRAARVKARDTRDYYERELRAEKAVGRYYEKSLTGRLFRGWRGVVERREAEKKAHDDMLLLQREIEKLKKTIVEKERVKKKVELSLRGEIEKKALRCRELEDAVNAEQRTRERERERVRVKGAEVAQQQAEGSMLREKNERLSQKLEKEEAARDDAVRQREEMRIRLEREAAGQVRFKQGVNVLIEVVAEAQQQLCPPPEVESFLQQLQPLDAGDDLDDEDDEDGRPERSQWNTTGAPGALWRWHRAVCGERSMQRGAASLTPSGTLCEDIVRGLRSLYPSEVSAKDVESVESEATAEAKSSAVYTLFRRIVGPSAPCSLHPFALAPPGSPAPAASLLTMLMLHVVAPPGPRKGSRKRRLSKEAGDDLTSETLRRITAGLRRAVREAADWRRALHSCVNDLTALLDGDTAPVGDPTEWGTALSRVVAAMPGRPLAEAEMVLSRLRANTAPLVALREAYSSADMKMNDKAVWTMLKDGGVVGSAKEREMKQAVMPALPPRRGQEVTPAHFTEAVLRAALWKYPPPKVRCDDAVDGIMHNTLLPLCTAPPTLTTFHSLNAAQGVPDVWRKYSPHLKALFAGYAVTVQSEQVLRLRGLKDCLGGCELLAGERKDPWHSITPQAVSQIFDASLHPATRHARQVQPAVGLTYLEFLNALTGVAQFWYPNPTVPLRARVRRLLHEHLVPIASRILQGEPPPHSSSQPRPTERQSSAVLESRQNSGLSRESSALLTRRTSDSLSQNPFA